MKKRVIKGIALFIWLVIIFCFSAQVASESRGTSESLLVKFYPLFSSFMTLEDFILTFETVIRKAAHFVEFFILGVLSYEFFKEFKINRRTLIVIIFCVLCALGDEIHQIFVPGRAFMIEDILLDSFASTCAILLFKHFNW